MILPLYKEFEIRALAVWGRARYLSVTEADHNIETKHVSGEETFHFCEAWRPEWGSNPRSPTFQAGSSYHYTRTSTQKGPSTEWDQPKDRQFNLGAYSDISYLKQYRISEYTLRWPRSCASFADVAPTLNHLWMGVPRSPGWLIIPLPYLVVQLHSGENWIHQ